MASDMLRRDFLKFLGLAGTAIALPSVGSDLSSVGNDLILPKPELSNAPLAIQLDFGKHKVDITFTEGEFTWSEEFHYVTERGLLDEVRVPLGYTFSLSIYCDTISDSDYINRIHNAREFDMVVIDKDVKYHLNGVQWQQMEYDLKQGLFYVSGQVPNMRIST